MCALCTLKRDIHAGTCARPATSTPHQHACCGAHSTADASAATLPALLLSASPVSACAYEAGLWYLLMLPPGPYDLTSPSISSGWGLFIKASRASPRLTPDEGAGNPGDGCVVSV
jgi:hypothetical protein